MTTKKETDNLLESIYSNKDRLYKTACIYLKNSEDASEAVQETVYKAYANIGKLREPEYLLTWVTKILINCCLDELRRKSRQDSRIEETVPYSPVNTEDLNSSIVLRQYVDSLDEKYREAVMLKYYGGYTAKEISYMKNIPESTVKTRLKRAIELLEKKMKGDGFNE